MVRNIQNHYFILDKGSLSDELHKSPVFWKTPIWQWWTILRFQSGCLQSQLAFKHLCQLILFERKEFSSQPGLDCLMGTLHTIHSLQGPLQWFPF